MALGGNLRLVLPLQDSKPNLQRRSPLRFGVVTALGIESGDAGVDPHSVRVQFSDLDEVESYWLKVPRRRTHSDHDAELPDVGDQVACLMDDYDEAGVIIGAVTSTADPVPAAFTKDRTYRDWDDGTVVYYDRAAHKFYIALGTGAALDATGNGGQIQLDGSGNVEVAGAQSITASAATEITLEAPNIYLDGDVHSGGGPVIVSQAESPYSPVTTAEVILASSGPSADTVINLPAASGSGRLITIKKMDANPHNIAVTPAGIDTIDGVAGADAIVQQWQSVGYYDYLAPVGPAPGGWVKL